MKGALSTRSTRARKKSRGVCKNLLPSVEAQKRAEEEIRFPEGSRWAQRLTTDWARDCVSPVYFFFFTNVCLY
jgi:hypothetical protein